MEGTIERKTQGNAAIDQATATSQQPDPFTLGNVLDKYKSYTYNIVLAALTPQQIQDPSLYENKSLDFVVLQSSGKKENQLNAENSSGININLQSGVAVDDNTGTPLAIRDKNLGKQIAENFNKKSPGRFDMFINDLEINSLGAFRSKTQTTLASTISFTVFEPYSTNGFLEALYFAAISAGYPNYISAAYLLKISFQGYPDGEDITEPETVPNSTRYLLIRFVDIEFDLTESGTKYRCKASPFHESAFGKANNLKKLIKIEARLKVGDVLKDFEGKLNSQTKTVDKAGRPAGNYVFDEYKIEFADYDGNIVTSNKISESNISELWKGENVYSFPDIGKDEVDENGKANRTTDPKTKKNLEQRDPGSLKLNPTKMAIHFKNGARVSECIAAIIRDSDYITSIVSLLKNKDQSPIDPQGMIEYFIIYPYVMPKEYDSVNRRQTYLYTYIIAPHKIHFTRIPRLQGVPWTSKTVNQLLVRKYKYFYSGQNNDLLGLKITVNGLFGEQVPGGMAAPFYLTSSGALARNEQSNVLDNPLDADSYFRSEVPTPPVFVDYEAGDTPNIGNAGPADRSAYGVLAKSLHKSVINSAAALIQTTFSIIGDPIFLVTPSSGKNRPKPLNSDPSKVFLVNGEANYLRQDMLIRLTFRNPVDINEQGFYEFSQSQTPYGGVFRITKLTHTFKDGVFLQNLEAIRLPGQINDEPITPVNPAEKTETQINYNNQSVPDQTDAPRTGVRARQSSLFSQLQNIASGIAALPSALANASTLALSSGVASLTSPLRDASSRLSENISQVNASISNVSNRITSAIQGVNYEIAQAGEKLGIDPSALRNAGPVTLAGLLTLSKSIPRGVNLTQAIQEGVNTNFPLANLSNLPPSQPKSVAPAVEQNLTDLENIVKSGGVSALAATFGVKTVEKIPSTILSPELSNLLSKEASAATISNPLSGLSEKLPLADFNKISNRTLATLNRVSSSVEVNISLSSQDTGAGLQSAVTTKLGSKISSPLAKFVDSNNT